MNKFHKFWVGTTTVLLTAVMLTSCSGGTSSNTGGGTPQSQNNNNNPQRTTTDRRLEQFQAESDAFWEEQRRLDQESLRQSNCLATLDGC
jgi:hypothetical protein